MANTERVHVPVDDGSELGLYVARPNTTAGGALIVLQEIFGVNSHIRDVTERFASEGYFAVAPDLFHRHSEWWEGSYSDPAPGRERAMATTQDNIRADLRATHAWVLKQLGQNARVAAVGFCMGGRQAFVANGTLPLACAVSFYGGNIPGLADLAPTQSGPLMMLWGGQDKHIDLAQRRAAHDMVRAAKKPFVDVTFDDADHGFFCNERASYQEAAAKQAWALVTAFLSAHI